MGHMSTRGMVIGHCRGAIKCNAVGIFSIAFGWRGLLAYVYSGVFV